jgi:protein HEXIM1/2
MVGGRDAGDPVAILPIEASEADLERRKVSEMEESDSDEGLGESNSGKKRRQQSRMKARRARRKAYRPYYQLTEEQRRVREDRERLRELKQQERMVAKGRITAPYNTTQFLMSDNKADNILLQLEEKLEARRGRHNSLSTEEVEEAEKEEAAEFMSSQFKADYQLQHLDRLESMTKELLLHEYMLLERKNETLEEKLEFMRGQEEEKARRGLVDYNFANGEYPMDPENAEKIKIFQAEIGRLQRENERLHLENSTIKESLTGRLLDDHNSSSSDSSSSSSSSSDSSSSSEDEDEEDSKECKGMQGRPEDTGYESTQSKEPTPPL